MTYLRTTALCALCALCTAPAIAQDAFELDTITVTANQTDTTLERSGSTVEVLPADDVRDAPTARLGDFLTFQPGISSSGNGPLGTTSTLRIRGLGGAYVPVLIDGIDVTDPASSGGGFDFGGLTNAGLGRIEVLKGSQSARFGQNAVAGVVNIESLRPTEDGVHGFAEVEAGSFDTRRGVLGLTARTDRTDLAFSISRTESDGFSASAAGTEDDGFDSTQANLYLRHQVTDIFAAGLSALYIDSRAEFDEFGGDGPAPFDEFNEREVTGVRLFTELETGPVSHELAYSTFETDRVSFSNGTPTPFKGERDRIEYRGSYDTGGIWALSFGGDYTEEQDLNQKIDIAGLQAELLLAPTDALDLALSVRHDDHSEFSGELSARAALAWRIRDDLILRASASDGFRAPTLSQLDPFFGDPTFQPETSVSYDLGLEKRLDGDDFIRVTLFSTEIDNQIFFDGNSTRCIAATPPNTGCFETGDFEGSGVEISGQAAINEFLTLSGAYTYTDAEQNGAAAARVPEHDLALGLRAQITPQFEAQFTLQHIAGVTPSTFAPTPNKVQDYTLVHINAAYQVTDNVDAFLRVENLFDEDYETAGGFNTSGRAAYVGLRASF
ncbi:vitamin B12 transporter [Roseovarius tolerans]|uniref:Vitamin B12 transporter n=1 Tax=Roseovarius tolerans TaxID=74031 RepID=A0A1H8CR94_9RHOB|nr:TonB-dependent receptor [Roseovarius tolerans]SEM97673.1 vitamin B12 transporter [Roseovarius tolerans]